MFRSNCVRWCCLVLLAASLSAFGAVITETDPTSWLNATTNSQTIDFNGLASLGATQNYGSNSGLTLDGVTFTGMLGSSSYQLYVVDPLTSWPDFQFSGIAGINSVLEGPVENRQSDASFLPYIHVVLPTPVTAFAVELMTKGPDGLSYSISLDGSPVFPNVATSPRPDQTFFGITSDTPFTTIDFMLPNAPLSGDAQMLLGSFSFGTAATSPLTSGEDPPPDVPEAGTSLLIGSGLVGMALLRRRLQRQKA
ncbi:MAG TPA: PEP-CTERM sorting domain-containing protein [Bryobacteraceae bacterium]|nr:PEP-CTERM sorting domain-containing protein [Bryobacteraceae bacterium]